MAKSGVKKDKSDPDSGGQIDAKYRGIDTAGESNEEKDSNFFSKQNASIFHNQVLGQTAPKTEDTTYADPPYTEKKDAKKLSDVRKKFAPSADKPTTASAKKGTKDLPKVVQEVDPQKKAQQLPELYQNMNQMNMLMSMGSGLMSGFGGGGGGGGSGPAYPIIIPASFSVTLTDAFTGALAILVRKFGFDTVLSMFIEITFPNNGLSQLDSYYQPIVTKAVSNLLKVALYYGPVDIPVSLYDETFYGDVIPDNVVQLTEIPDYYKKQYYTIDTEPYPGYDQWIDPNITTNILYVRREAGSYVFKSANEEVYSTAEKGIAADLDKYFYVDPTQVSLADGAQPLFPRYLNQVLDKWMLNIEVQYMNLTMGNNVGSGGGGGNMAGMLAGMLGGLLQQLMQMFQQQQLGSTNGTVVSSGSMNDLIQQATKDMGINNQILEAGKSAVGGGGLGGIGNFGNMSDVLGMAGLGDMGGMFGGLMGGFGNLGGGSNGGGGGAGSGFPEATIGGTGAYQTQTNSGLSNTQISSMTTLVTQLGIENT